jgi:hypothetical protein
MLVQVFSASRLTRPRDQVRLEYVRAVPLTLGDHGPHPESTPGEQSSVIDTRLTIARGFQQHGTKVLRGKSLTLKALAEIPRHLVRVTSCLRPASG